MADFSNLCDNYWFTMVYTTVIAGIIIAGKTSHWTNFLLRCLGIILALKVKRTQTWDWLSTTIPCQIDVLLWKSYNTNIKHRFNINSTRRSILILKFELFMRFEQMNNCLAEVSLAIFWRSTINSFVCSVICYGRCANQLYSVSPKFKIVFYLLYTIVQISL